MIELNYVAAFLIGLAGGVHCIGMCGGIASAFSFAIPKGQKHALYIAAYNAGRVLSYTLAGGISGYVGAIFSSSVVTGLLILQTLSIVFLLLLALYISELYKGLRHLESIGGRIWKKVSPLSKKLIPFKSPWHTILYGMIWGWLPCGLVYSALTWSMASASSFQGALLMLSFGAGTLPAVVATSLGASFLLPLLQKKSTRLAVAVLLAIFALVLAINLLTNLHH